MKIHILTKGPNPSHYVFTLETILENGISWIVNAIKGSIARKANICFSFLDDASGEGVIVAEDKLFQNKFLMCHEEGHIVLGHYKADSNCKFINGKLFDPQAEMAADQYAVEKTKDPKLAIRTLRELQLKMDPSILEPRGYAAAFSRYTDRIDNLMARYLE